MLPAVQTFDIRRSDKSAEPWRLVILPDRLRFEQVNGAVRRIVPVLEARQRLIIALLAGKEGLLAFKTEGKDQFKASREAIEAIRSWMPGRTREDLEKLICPRAAWQAGLGALSLIGAALLFTRISAPHHYIGVGVSFSAGLVLLALAAISRWRPHRVVFLVEALGWLIFGSMHVHTFADGRGTWWTGFMLLTCLLLAGTSVKRFREFGDVTTAEAILAERRSTMTQNPEILDAVVEPAANEGSG